MAEIYKTFMAEAEKLDPEGFAKARAERAELEALRKDAERYRWLRAQHWNTGQLCVVAEPKDAVKLGHCCPSGEYLDIAVDDAMLIGRAVGAA